MLSLPAGRSWAQENPELVIILCLVALAFYVEWLGRDSSAITSGVFGFLAKGALDAAREGGKDDDGE